MTSRQKLFNRIVAEQNEALKGVTAPAEWHRAAAQVDAEKTIIGIALVSERFGYYSVTFDGKVRGDSRRDVREKIEAEAREIVRRDPDYKQLSADLAV